jgi:Flp pilus assembly CpaF family ATPase
MVGVRSRAVPIKINTIIDRITNLASAGAATIPYEHIHRQVKKNFDVMVHVQRTGRGARRIVELAELVDGTVRTLWRWNARLNTHEAVGTSVLAAELTE